MLRAFLIFAWTALLLHPAHAADPLSAGPFQVTIDDSLFSKKTSFDADILGDLERASNDPRLKDLHANLKVRLIPARSKAESPKVKWTNSTEAEILWPVEEVLIESGASLQLVPLNADQLSPISIDDAPQIAEALKTNIEDSLKPAQLQCAPPPPPPIARKPATTALGAKLRKEQIQTKDCPKSFPKSFSDIQKLKKLADRLIAQGAYKNVDITPLYVSKEALQHPEGHRLGMSCGYNSHSKKWFRTMIHATDPNTIFYQGGEGLNINCEQLRRSLKKGEEGIFIVEGKSCDGEMSYREDRGLLGDVLFIPISDGVYITVYRTTGEPFYYGLVFAPIEK